MSDNNDHQTPEQVPQTDKALSTEVTPTVATDEAETSVEPIPETKPAGRFKRVWLVLTGTRKRVIISITVLVIILAAVIGLTSLKYAVLGWAIKSQYVVQVTDGDTHQLLPGAVVSVAGASVTTDKTGLAHFTNVHPGSTTLTVAKSAYQSWSSNITLKFGDNGTRDAELTSTGIRVSFKLTNYVTGKPVSGQRVQVGDADVVSAADGTVAASVSPSSDGQTLSAKITGDGYNDLSLNVKVTPGASPLVTKVVPSGDVYFLSNRSGRVDLYQANLDGSSPTVILPGTGNEDGSTGILANVYDQSVIALVSSRAGHRVDGQLQEDLYLFRPASKQLTLVQSGSSYSDYRTWLGKALIYQYDGSNTESRSIKSYDSTTGKNTTIVTCTSDHACPTALYSTDDVFIYSLEGAPTGSTSVGIFAVKSGSTTAKTISSLPATSTSRSIKNTLLLNYYGYNSVTGNYGDSWQSLNLDTTTISAITNGPSNTSNRTYVDSPGDKYSVSVDTRDGQSDLYLTDEDGSNERQLTSTGKVDQFVQWFGDDYVVYSSANQLFVVGVAGGNPQKITNFYSGSVQGYGGGYSPNYN